LAEIMIVRLERNWLNGRVRLILSRVWLAASLMLGAIPFASAQSGPTAQEADRQLNQNYQAALRKMTPSAAETLRRAERAWVAFMEKNSVALKVAARELGVSTSVCQQVDAEERSSRAWDFSVSSEPEENGQQIFERADAELNVVYKRITSSLPAASTVALREAQRAWVDYRTANRPYGLVHCARLTSRRTEQLSRFYVIATTPQLPETAAQKSTVKVPDPFERAR
jgi:uncharacterized protein YecT (DUF1311 family)